jgi:hypothetical protein
VNTHDTAVRVRSILRCAKVGYCTRTRTTCFGNTAGIPIPVRNPRDATDIDQINKIFELIGWWHSHGASVSVTASEFRFWYICTLSDYRLLSVRLHVYLLCISSNQYYGSISDLSALVLGAIGTLPASKVSKLLCTVASSISSTLCSLLMELILVQHFLTLLVKQILHCRNNKTNLLPHKFLGNFGIPHCKFRRKVPKICAGCHFQPIFFFGFGANISVKKR